MATVFRSGSWNCETVHSTVALRRRSCVSCRANKQTTSESGPKPTAIFNVATGVAISLAATTLLCSTDVAMAARVQGGDLGDLDLFSSAKTGVIVTEPKVKSVFGPSPPPQKEAPKVAKPVPPPPPPVVPKKSVKKQAPVKKPAAKSQPAKPIQKTQPAKPIQKKEPVKPIQKTQSAKPIQKKEPVKPIQKTQPAKPIQKTQPVQPPSKPSLSDLLKKERTKEPVQKIVPPIKSAAPSVKKFSTPSISLPTTVSTSSKDATEAGIVLGVEVLLALIASSAVGGLLKKA